MNGWYYDEQLFDPLTSVSLHPNQKFVSEVRNGNKHLVWKDFEQCESDNESYYKEGDGDKNSGCGYGLVPIARSILAEDFNVALSNQWSPVNGDDLVSGLWQQGRTIAPYLPIIGLALDTAEENLNNYQPNEEAKATKKIKGILDLVVNGAQKGLDVIKKHINDHLVTQGTRFTYYSGTGTAFGNLSMRYTIFPEIRNGELYSVQKQVAELLPYINGEYDTDNPLEIVRLALHAYSNISGKASEEVDAKFKELTDKLKADPNQGKIKQKVGQAGDKVREAISEFNGWVRKFTDKAISIADDVLDEIEKRKLFGWQHPPGGYEPLYKDIDSTLKGTLKLKIGNQYSLSSLLCQDATFNFSKIMVKDLNNKGRLSPLYCDVVLNLTPATKFANKSLEKFVNGTELMSLDGRGGESENVNRITARLNLEREKQKQSYPGTESIEIPKPDIKINDRPIGDLRTEIPILNTNTKSNIIMSGFATEQMSGISKALGIL